MGDFILTMGLKEKRMKLPAVFRKVSLVFITIFLCTIFSVGSSFAKDKIIESIEPTDTLNHPFILGVQWHPEAVKVRNPLSGSLGRRFLYKVNQHFLID